MSNATVQNEKSRCLDFASKCYAQGKLHATKELLEYASLIDPKDKKVLASLGEICFSIGDYPAAGKAFISAAFLDGEDHNVILQLARVHQKLGQNDEAGMHLSHLAQVRRDNPEVTKAYGEFLLATNKLDDAARFLDSIMSEFGESSELLVQMGVCLFKKADYCLAEICFERALRLQPGNTLASDNAKAARESGSALRKELALKVLSN